MLTLKIQFDEILIAEPGNFGVIIDAEKDITRTPSALNEILTEHGLRNAVDLLSAARGTPSYFIEGLQWSLSDVQIAAEKLTEQLKGYVAEDFLYPPLRPEFPGGVTIPPGLMDPRLVRH